MQLEYSLYISTFTTNKKLKQVYSHHPCKKPLMEKVLLNRAKDLFF